ncbi:MAG: PQQ-dependent sugar dehydrogenase, partial [Planctomycetes bacterium]|nr:PQQ-dependent sugar dehydrogenase [Planctomycetota bacterium]
MLGFALDPAFLANGRIYLLYVVDHHHLAHFGTPAYDPNSDEYFLDTIGRVTRYTCDASTGFRSVDPASRMVLVGESISTGIPVLNQSHGLGALVFGADGTLFVSAGDNASYDESDHGGPVLGSSNTGRAEGIIDLAQDVGSYRAQFLGSLDGKVLRIDPATGDGVGSNPFFDTAAPRSPRSRVWALGFRNPFRMVLRPGTGSADPTVGDPGTLYVTDVGWTLREDLDVGDAPAMNFGWPLHEGLTPEPLFAGVDALNRESWNPLFL